MALRRKIDVRKSLCELERERVGLALSSGAGEMEHTLSTVLRGSSAGCSRALRPCTRFSFVSVASEGHVERVCFPTGAVCVPTGAAAVC